MVTDASDAAVVGDDAAAVAVDQTQDEFFGRLVDERLLPRFEGDVAVVLAAGAVLGEEARPVLGVLLDLDASLLANEARVLARHQCVDGRAATADDRGVLGIEDYS